MSERKDLLVKCTVNFCADNYSQETLPSEKGVELQEKTPISMHEKSPESLADLDEDLDAKPSTTNLYQPPENGAHSDNNDVNIV